MKSIVHIPHPVLTTPTKPVVSFDKKLATVISDMKATLRHATKPKGVGLAAPQIGVGLQLFLTRPTPKDEIRIFINPTILASDLPQPNTDKTNQLEGCLSIPGVWGTVNRSPKLTLRFQDETGKTQEEVITGFLATIVQHEMDHLQGVLFTQRVLEQKNKFYQATTDEKGKEILEEVVI
jgi:peptide deformylase